MKFYYDLSLRLSFFFLNLIMHVMLRLGLVGVVNHDPDELNCYILLEDFFFFFFLSYFSRGRFLAYHTGELLMRYFSIHWDNNNNSKGQHSYYMRVIALFFFFFPCQLFITLNLSPYLRVSWVNTGLLRLSRDLILLLLLMVNLPVNK